ncbi:Nn.00g090590.m01.CDS01 [Neocucurbitaria sp. VM-36]
MPPFNKIVSKKFISNVVKDGKTVAVSAATKTSTWTRDDAIAQKVGELLKDSLGNWSGQLPEGTEEICSRETEHKSDSDKRNHITAVCFDAKGQGKTIHVPVKKA